MAIGYTFPGVYPNIKDLSQIVTANSITSCAYVGEAEFGPINTPVLVSNLKQYVDLFGELNSKYGYMGYSLAVAAETINSHYVVRVVNKDSAKYAFAKIAKRGSTTDVDDNDISVGYTIDEVEQAKEDASILFIDGEGTKDDLHSMIVVANNPNNKKYSVEIVDNTIITEKALLSTSTTVSYKNGTVDEEVEADVNLETFISNLATSLGTAYADLELSLLDASSTQKQVVFTGISASKKLYLSDTANGKLLAALGLTAGCYDDKNIIGSPFTTFTTFDSTLVGESIVINISPIIMTVNYLNDTIENIGLKNGDNVVISNASNVEFNGTFAISNVATNSFDVEIPNKIEDPTAPVSIRFVKYPDADETAFGIKVYETIGKVTALVEQYTNLTLYMNKDNLGNSTFVEDIVNNNSPYIQVFVNPNITSINEQVPQVTGLADGKLVGGTSGEAATLNDLLAGWEQFRDRSQTTVTLLMNSGYANKDNVAYQSKMLEIAEARRDCFCLFDSPMTEGKADNLIDWRKNIQGFNTYRGAISAPWVKTYDSIQGRPNFLMAPSAYVAKIMGIANPWIAPAGMNRGILTSSTVSPIGLAQYYDETVGGNLYSNQVNCIIKNPGAGYVNWGQKTLQQKPSALDRINVARTVIFIETTLRDAARSHLFENNTAFERMQVTLQFNQFLDTILTADGIQRYKVVCDDSNNTPYIIANNQMVIDVYLWPTYTTEFIELNTIVMGPDASVSVSTGA